MNTDTANLTDAQLDAAIDRQWQNVQSVTRGKSNRAIDNAWKTYDALVDERRNRQNKGA